MIGETYMPAKSEKQRRYLYSNFGAAWVRKHHFNTEGKLPTRVKRKKKRSKK